MTTNTIYTERKCQTCNEFHPAAGPYGTCGLTGLRKNLMSLCRDWTSQKEAYPTIPVDAYGRYYQPKPYQGFGLDPMGEMR